MRSHCPPLSGPRRRYRGWAVEQVAERLFLTGADPGRGRGAWNDQSKTVKAFYRRLAREAIEAVTAVLALAEAAE